MTCVAAVVRLNTRSPWDNDDLGTITGTLVPAESFEHTLIHYFMA